MWRLMIVAMMVACNGGDSEDTDFIGGACEAGEADCSCFPGFGDNDPTCIDEEYTCMEGICVLAAS